MQRHAASRAPPRARIPTPNVAPSATRSTAGRRSPGVIPIERHGGHERDERAPTSARPRRGRRPAGAGASRSGPTGSATAAGWRRPRRGTTPRRSPSRAAATTAPRTTTVEASWMSEASSAETPELVGDRARREVVRRRDRVADLADEGRRSPTRRPTPASTVASDRQARQDDRPDDRPPRHRRGQDGPDEDDPRLELDRRPQRGARPEPDRVVQPAPADREQQEQDRADLAELDRVGERPRQPGQQDDPPADRPRHRQDARPDRERRDQERGPDPDRRRRGQQAERQDERRERRRVVEQPEAAGRLEAHVVQRLAVEQADRGLVVGQEVEAERVAGRGPTG